MRLFVALDIPEDVRRRIANYARELRKHEPQARWARIDGAHVTLKFIGEVPAERLDPIRQALEPVRAPAPIRIEFRGAGFFASDRRPRVLWTGVHAPPGLSELATEIENRLEPLGIPRESRSFHPHITLARFDRPLRGDELREAVAGAAQREFGSIVVREFYLYESRLVRGGAIYTRLDTIVFAPEAS